MDNEENVRGLTLMRDIEFGLRVQQFLSGPIGERILHDTEAETKELLAALAELDPDVEADRAQVRQIRQKLGILAHWQDAFARYIETGKKAEVEFQEGEFSE